MANGNNEMKTKVSEYVELLNQIESAVGNNDAAAMILHELSKDRRMEVIRAERQAARETEQHGDDERATERQRDYLKSLGVTVPRGCSKQRASELISEALAKVGV